ncbi:MAG: aminotransferase class I/II-fold pyridoxal phosphate-dependent enzyme [Candidatus Odinarchaeota archaeon]
MGKLEKEYLVEAVNQNYISVFGPFVPEFEEKFAAYVGAKKAISVQSGTAAIHIALHELGIGQNEEIIVPSLTFIATINPVLYVGAKPVIVDVNPFTWTIDPDEIKRAITENTKAIIPVHLYGNTCNMDKIMELAREHGLHVIEDATESLGATYRGKQTGTFGDFGCFSFNGNKVITTGGGGMIVTDDEKKADHIKFLVNQARDNSKGYFHPEMGFNYRMTNVEAALGLAQLKRIDEFLEKKQRFRKAYKDVLKDLSFIKFQEEDQNVSGSWWLNCIKIEKDVNIDLLIKKFKKKDIPTRRTFIPASEMPYIKKYSRPCQNSYDIYHKGLCLPSSTLNEVEDIFKAANLIKHTLENF